MRTEDAQPAGAREIWRSAIDSFLDGFHQVIRLYGLPTKNDVRDAWRSGRRGFAIGFREGMAVYTSPLSALLRALAAVFSRRARSRG